METGINLVERLADDFSASARNRGQGYFWQHRVRILRGSDTELEAFVVGSDRYDVTLKWKDGVLVSSCGCTHFVESGEPCKHLWACILAADAEGYLSAAATATDVFLDVDDFNLDEDLEPIGDAVWSRSVSRATKPSKLARPPVWRREIAEISAHGLMSKITYTWPPNRQLVYLVDVSRSLSAGSLIFGVTSRESKRDGTWKYHRTLTLSCNQIGQLPVAEDREILSVLMGGFEQYGYRSPYSAVPTSYSVLPPLETIVVGLAARTGRCYLQLQGGTELIPLAWDEGDPWQFKLEMRRLDTGGCEVIGALRRGEERMDTGAPVLITPGFVFTRDRVARLLDETPFGWLSHFRKLGRLQAPEGDENELLATLLCSPGLPLLEVSDELRYDEVVFHPRPRLLVRTVNAGFRAKGRLEAEVSFDYEGRIVPATEPARGFYEAANRRFLRRDANAEKEAIELVTNLGFKLISNYTRPKPVWELAPSKLPGVVRVLVEAGWHIEAHGKVFRRPGAFRIEVSTGIDWLELHGTVEYGETTAGLPALLEALRRGDNMVRLDDGTYGMLPEEWLRRLGPVAGLGTADSDHIRFRPSQAGLLDALLVTQPEAKWDETFERIRQELRSFQGIKPADQPAGFLGQLRDYQLEGLGWMHFLRGFCFGGCLADDMGVGKTAQVLGLLETRRELRATGEPLGPSLVVVPRSLIFNWRQEAARFTPQIRVLDYSTQARNGSDFSQYDVILVTYGTLRRDIMHLKEVAFDYVVLDEAQAVKNAGTESAKAVRLLQGKYRLVLSGTPVENHLGELWSLFDFLNPGMLGAARVFKVAGTAALNPDRETRDLLAAALRPFILRRTKEQVARELPEKTEQTLYCEMEPAQRKLYNELRQHYRNSLLARIETEGLPKAKIHVLEALLRLRQAACHPGLLDPKRATEPSAKMEVLLAHLSEVVEEGHKALVFSQFTSLLRIVRQHLDATGVTYEYLDGATRDRQARVKRFQSDKDCQLFLISLRAGGLGLNLTSAEYIFLLDPWWNPAVEAQAIDRAHRIGQTRQVFAYRLIARDTVEEKVLELQKTKRDLADAIIRADNSLVGQLCREDVELLLS